MRETLCIFLYLNFSCIPPEIKNQNIFNKTLPWKFSFKCISWSLQRTPFCLLSNWNVCFVHKKMHCGRIITFPPDSFFHLNVNLYLLLAYIILAISRSMSDNVKPNMQYHMHLQNVFFLKSNVMTQILKEWCRLEVLATLVIWKYILIRYLNFFVKKLLLHFKIFSN